MKHLAQLVQQCAQVAYTIASLFIDKTLDRLEFEDRRAHALPGLIVKIVSEPEPFFLLRAHNPATELVALGPVSFDELVRRQKRTSYFVHLLYGTRRHDE